MSFFATNLKNLRLDNDYSQIYVASAIGIGRSTYSNYENGISEPTIDTLIKLSKLFNCSIDSLVGMKIDTSINQYPPSINIDLNEFNLNSLKQTLLKNKNYYMKKKLTIIDEINNKINEIDTLLEYIDNQKTNTANSHEEFADEIAPNISLVKKNDTHDKVDEVKFRRLPRFDSVAAGSPNYPCEDIVGFVYVPEDRLCSSKDYFAINVKGDSMNEVYADGEVLLVEKTTFVENNDLVIALISPNTCESTFKKFRKNDNDNNIFLYPMSTNPIYKPQVYNSEDVMISGKVLGKLSDFIN